MNAAKFDLLSRVLATTPSRRVALTLFTGALSALLGLGTPPNAAAQARPCRRLHRRCFPERGLDCCAGVCRNGRCRCSRRQRAVRGRCIPKRQRCGSGQCGGGQVCRNGRCHCPPGKRRCGKRCIAQAACCRNADCGAGRACIGNTCKCLPDFKPCGEGCIAQAACCGGCDPDQNCVNGTCEAKRSGTGGPCRVFLTSTTYQGDLREDGQGSGIAGADAKCQARANASARTQGGTYKAWLSGSTLVSSPAQRFTSTDNTGPYVLVDDAATVIANDWADLTDGTLLAPINVTELGQGGGAAPWTHTQANGTTSGDDDWHCQEWTSAAPGVLGELGDQFSTNSAWTLDFALSCNVNQALYCFEQG